MGRIPEHLCLEINSVSESERTMTKTVFGITVAVGLAVSSYAAPVPTIQALPSAVSGQPGSIVGWGLTLTYTAPADWVILNDSFFTGSQVYGTYHDYVSSENIVAGPPPESSTITVPFSRGSSGLGEFDIFTKVPYTSISGNIVVDYEIFSQDPNSLTFDPSSYVGSGQASAPLAVNIVPEPQTFGLIFVAIAFSRFVMVAFEPYRSKR